MSTHPLPHRPPRPRLDHAPRLAASIPFALALVLAASGAASAAPGMLMRLDPDEPLLVRFSATGLQDSGLSFVLWRFGDKTSSTQAAATHRYALAKSYTVTLVLQNQSGTRQRLQRTLDLARPPKVEIVEATELDRAARRWRFRAAASSPVTTIRAATARWKLGDGKAGTGETVEHAYAAAGTFVVRAEATDSRGVVVQDRLELEVSEWEPTRIAFDFETLPSPLPAGPIVQVRDPALAHGGTGALEAHLDSSGGFAGLAMPDFVVQKLVGFLFERQTIEARLFVRWNAPLSIDWRRLRAALQTYLAAHALEAPAETAAEQLDRLWHALEQLESQSSSPLVFEGGRWYCLGIAYRFPTAFSLASLAFLVDGTPRFEVEGLVLWLDLPLLELVFGRLVEGGVINTTATRAWLDDLAVANDEVDCGATP